MRTFEFNHSIDLFTMSPWQDSGKHRQIRVRSPCFASSANRFSSAYTSPFILIRSHNHRRYAMRQGVWIELIFEKRRPELRTEGKVIGIDRGFRKAFVTSDGQEIGAELRGQIRRKGKRSKTSYAPTIHQAAFTFWSSPYSSTADPRSGALSPLQQRDERSAIFPI